jgi:hypothetical protein
MILIQHSGKHIYRAHTHYLIAINSIYYHIISSVLYSFLMNINLMIYTITNVDVALYMMILIKHLVL